jgi:hypothetical protein
MSISLNIEVVVVGAAGDAENALQDPNNRKKR